MGWPEWLIDLACVERQSQHGAETGHEGRGGFAPEGYPAVQGRSFSGGDGRHESSDEVHLIDIPSGPARCVPDVFTLGARASSMVNTAPMTALAYRLAISRPFAPPPAEQTTGWPCSEGGMGSGPRDETNSPCRLIASIFSGSMNRPFVMSLIQASCCQLPQRACVI